MWQPEFSIPNALPSDFSWAAWPLQAIGAVMADQKFNIRLHRLTCTRFAWPFHSTDRVWFLAICDSERVGAWLFESVVGRGKLWINKFTLLLEIKLLPLVWKALCTDPRETKRFYNKRAQFNVENFVCWQQRLPSAKWNQKNLKAPLMTHFRKQLERYLQ